MHLDATRTSAFRATSAIGSACEHPDITSMMSAFAERAERHLQETTAVHDLVARSCVSSVAVAAHLIGDAFARGHKLMLCGNGGSAADCQHVATEFVSRLRADRERPALPALALTTDTSFLTAYANDCGYDGVFARQVEAFGQIGDVLMAISTSGRSTNVAKAVEAAHAAGVRTIGLSGEGGRLKTEVDLAIAVPSRDTQVIQECMLSIEHALCELVEESLFGDLRRSAIS